MVGNLDGWFLKSFSIYLQLNDNKGIIAKNC
jgi:hypothetical protein